MEIISDEVVVGVWNFNDFFVKIICNCVRWDIVINLLGCLLIDKWCYVIKKKFCLNIWSNINVGVLFYFVDIEELRISLVNKIKVSYFLWGRRGISLINSSVSNFVYFEVFFYFIGVILW